MLCLELYRPMNMLSSLVTKKWAFLLPCSGVHVNGGYVTWWRCGIGNGACGLSGREQAQRAVRGRLGGPGGKLSFQQKKYCSDN